MCCRVATTNSQVEHTLEQNLTNPAPPDNLVRHGMQPLSQGRKVGIRSGCQVLGQVVVHVPDDGILENIDGSFDCSLG